MDKRQKAGFTIIEVLVAMTIALLAFGMASSFLIQVSRGVSRSEEYLSHRTSTRLLVSRLYQEARASREIYECTGTAFEFLFKGLDEVEQRVRYEYDSDGEIFTRTVISGGSGERVLAEDLKNAQFKFFDRTGEEIESTYVSNINANAVQFIFTDSIELESNIKISQLESPIIMLRNKRLVR